MFCRFKNDNWTIANSLKIVKWVKNILTGKLKEQLFINRKLSKLIQFYNG